MLTRFENSRKQDREIILRHVNLRVESGVSSVIPEVGPFNRDGEKVGEQQERVDALSELSKLRSLNHVRPAVFNLANRFSSIFFSSDDQRKDNRGFFQLVAASMGRAACP